MERHLPGQRTAAFTPSALRPTWSTLAPRLACTQGLGNARASCHQRFIR